MEDLLARVREALSDRFDVRNVIGSGGMATVFHGWDRSLERPVALKVLKPDLSSGIPRERFVREVALASRLTHPHIVPILSDGEADGLLYYVMPFVRGETVRHRLLREGAIPLPHAIRWAAEVADALAYAHSMGIIHRDIKPENILLSEGHALVADFGIARALRDNAIPLTLDGTAIGTPNYMSPEQAMGEPVDNRTDIYSLGCVIYEMLVGTRPFDSLPSPFARNPNEPIPPVSDVSPTPMPPQLDAAIVKALSWQPADRFESAASFASALHDIQNVVGIPEVASARGIMVRGWMALGGIAVLVLILAVVISKVLPRGAVRGEQTLAVLPFEHMGDADLAYFSEGVTDEIINRLARSRGLRVIARTGVLPTDLASRSLEEIGRELRAEYVLRGTVTIEDAPRGGARATISPELHRTGQAESWRFDPVAANLQPGDLLRVQADIADRVAAVLNLTILDASRAESQSSNSAAYESYLRGLFHWRRGVLASSNRERLLAIDAYRQAIELDPEFAVAHAKLAGADSWAFSAYVDHSPERLRRARLHARRALALDADLPDTYVALGWIEISASRNFVSALEHFEHAVQIDESHPDALYGVAYVEQRRGNLDRALEFFSRRLAVDPLSSHAVLNPGTIYAAQGNLATAESLYTRAVELQRDLYIPYSRLAQLYLTLGDRERASAVLERAVQNMGHGEFIARFANDWRPLIRTLGQEYLASLDLLPITAFENDTSRYHLVKALVAGERDATDQRTAHLDSARTYLERRARIWPDHPEHHSELGIVLAGLHRAPEAVREGGLAVRLAEREGNVQETGVRLRDLAEIYLSVGNGDSAMVTLEKMFASPIRLAPALLRSDPVWNSLRDSPEFVAILSR